MTARVRSKPRPGADAERETMRAQIADPDIGSIKRRQLQRALAGVVAIGPSAPPELPQPPTRAAQISAIRATAEVSRAHRRTVENELKAIDARIEQINQRFAASRPGTITDEFQEAAAERRMLRELRTMIEADEPITVDRNGRAIDDRSRRYIKFRARELAESSWTNAERALAEGDHRRARRLRVDALRSRQIAEFELGWRASLPGYGNIAAWN